MLKLESKINIKVVSVGNRGCNVLERLNKLKKNGVEFCAISKAGEAFNGLRIENKIELPYSFDLDHNKNIDKMAKSVVNEKQKEIIELARGTDIVFFVCNLANKASVLQTKEIAQTFKKTGSLVFFVGATPFHFEGKIRRELVEKARKDLNKEVDALLIIDNEKVAKREISANEAFTQVDSIVSGVIDSILDIIIKEGIINIDFADLKTIVQNSGETFFNNSTGSKKEIVTVINNLFSKSNLSIQKNSFSKVLYVIYAGKNLLTNEVKQIGEKIHQKTRGNEKIIFGIVEDKKMKDKLKIVMIGS